MRMRDRKEKPNGEWRIAGYDAPRLRGHIHPGSYETGWVRSLHYFFLLNFKTHIFADTTDFQWVFFNATSVQIT